MNRSGMKRGLAVSAITALALSGLAMAPAQARTIAQGEVGVDLYTGEQSNAYTNQFDGNNTSVQLFAGVDDGIAGQNSVRFSYLKGATQVNIQTVTITDGVATADWVAPAGAEGAAITGLRAEVLDVNNNVLNTDDAFVVGTATPNVGSQPVSIAANNRDEVGLNLDGEVVITGKTREGVAAVGDTFPNTLVTNRGPVSLGGDASAFSTDIADVNALTPYAALVTVDPPNLTADPVDEIVVQTRIFAEGDDTRVLSVYDQLVQSISKATAPGFPANVAGNGFFEHTRWVVSVKDQKGNPVSGLDIYESNENGTNVAAASGMGRLVDNSAAFNDGETDHNGQLTVRLNEGPAPVGYGIDGAQDLDPAAGTGLTYVVVDVNQDGNFDNGVDQILPLTISSLPQDAATIDITSSLGNALDADEDTDLTFTVKDANGDPIQSANVTGTIDRDVADDAPADSSTPFGPLVTDANGEVTLPGQNLGVNNNKVDVTVNATSGPATGTLAVETDEAVITWDDHPSAQALATTDTTEGGVVALPSGTVLPDRLIGVTLSHDLGASPLSNSVVAPNAEQPAGTLTGSPTTASSTTDADGRFAVKIDDPALPNGQELNNLLEGSANTVATGFNINAGDCPLPALPGFPNCLSLDLDWLRSLTVSRVEIRNDVGGTTADGLRGGLDPANLIPGGLGIGEVVAFNSDDVELEDVAVELTLDEGFFVSIEDAFENVAIGNVIDFKSAGQTITVDTGDQLASPGIGSAKGAFLANIERHAGFDDDGLVEDEIHASAGTAADEHDLTWTTRAVPINPRATNPLVVELSADQESSILPKARAGDITGSGQEVDYDVNTFDQFENPTRQNTTTDDSNPLADFAGGGQSDFALFQPAISAFADSATNQSLEVELEGERTVTYNSNPGDSSFDVANPLAFLQIGAVNIEENTAPINWYELDLATSEFSLSQAGPQVVPVGTTVTEVLTAVDQEGQYIEGLFVDFLRGGPGTEDDDSCNEDLLNNCQRLNKNGKAFYDFAGGSEGLANITAVIYEDDGTRFGVVGTDTVRFSGTGPITPTKKRINPAIKGKNVRNGNDRIIVRAKAADGAKVKLFKIVGKNRRVLIKEGKLNSNGVYKTTIRDRNGRNITAYKAVVSPTADTQRGVTNRRQQPRIS